MSDKVEKLPGRQIPVPSDSSVDFSTFKQVKPLEQSDLTVIKNLTKELLETGVLEKAVEERDAQSLEELNEIVAEAISLAKSEKELNPDYYDASAEESLGEDLSSIDDWENPSLDGIDDYGVQVYEAYNSDDEIKKSNYSSNESAVKVRLPDGRIVFIEFL